jgi:hypothetical protein
MVQNKKEREIKEFDKESKITVDFTGIEKIFQDLVSDIKTSRSLTENFLDSTEEKFLESIKKHEDPQVVESFCKQIDNQKDLYRFIDKINTFKSQRSKTIKQKVLLEKHMEAEKIINIIRKEYSKFSE